ncbi:MAG: hypothetical protein JWM11_5499 [Planctomycetaceae bacterium]|nr:hypothetical protein [Planctomycetaceae bacterium]
MPLALFMRKDQGPVDSPQLETRARSKTGRHRVLTLSAPVCEDEPCHCLIPRAGIKQWHVTGRSKVKALWPVLAEQMVRRSGTQSQFLSRTHLGCSGRFTGFIWELTVSSGTLKVKPLWP